MAKKAQPSEKSLVIVESPAKARTINRYLGDGYDVVASMGHVRDLPVKDFGIDLQNDFEPVYELLAEKKKVIRDLLKVSAKADKVYLATDLDREGEAIAWHLMAALDLDPRRTRRVVFNEITKSAIQSAFAHPREVDMDKVNAQQARRILDRIVGYQLSPLLQSKLGRGLSAGRVQSVAVRLVVEREQEIRAFIPEETWRIHACFSPDTVRADSHRRAWSEFLAGFKQPDAGPTVKQRNAWLSEHGCLYAELVKLGGHEFKPSHVADARAVVEMLGFKTERVEEQPFEPYTEKDLKRITLHGRTEPSKSVACAIREIQKRRSITKPNPPFTTATLQQAASTELGFAPARTMRVAQQLYEGVEIGAADGPVGLITYMRTDSTNLSRESVEAVRGMIRSTFGEPYLPAEPHVFRAGKGAQEAHEAIRPTDAAHRPTGLRGKLTDEQFKLYDLIWRRFVACQMAPAQWDSTTILIAANTPKGEALFRTSGRRLVFDGCLKVTGVPTDGDVVLPEVKEGAPVTMLELDPLQQYSSPPSRYTEASLIKKLEAEGIGRPSTYAAIIQTVQDRGYVDLLDKRLHPTARGELVTERLLAHFPTILDLKFTSFMEQELDKIEDAHLDWVHVLTEFYEPFKQALDRAQAEMKPLRAEPSEYTCPTCGRDMVYRIGKNGRFLSCSGYPDCTVTRNIDKDGKPIEEVVAAEPCSVCGKPMVLKKSRRGPFLGCSGYPECTNTLPSDEKGVPLKKVKPEELTDTCDECGSKMTVRFARGRGFLACTGYPKCKATKPIPPGFYVEKPPPQDAGARCDKCGRAMVIRKGRRGPFLSCSGFPRCRNAMPMEKLDYLKQLAADGKIPAAPLEPKNGKTNGARGKRAAGKAAAAKTDPKELGPPPPGFAWTRTGKPVVEDWPDDSLTCPDCGADVTLKNGRYGPYFGCSAYPKCSFVANLRGEAKKRAAAEMPATVKPKPVPTDIRCEECGSNMVIRQGRQGPFLGCGRYPKCKATKPLPAGMAVEAAAGS